MATMKRLRSAIPTYSRVLDVGGANVNGSYRELFADCSYASLDYALADIVVSSYDWPIADGTYDAVICGQTLEHDPRFWLTMQNIARVLCPGGVLILIVPSAGGVHRYPIDAWRFLPDAMLALAEWAGLVVERVEQGSGKWRDLAAVMRKPVGP